MNHINSFQTMFGEVSLPLSAAAELYRGVLRWTY